MMKLQMGEMIQKTHLIILRLNIIKFINSNDRFKNTFGYSKSASSRMVTKYDDKESTYEGFKSMLTYLGQYNFNLDNKIIYGSDRIFWENILLIRELIKLQMRKFIPNI